MPREINYSKIDEPLEKRCRAINDVRAWLGETAFHKVADEIARTPVAERHYKMVRGLAFQLEMFAGVSGYPVAAWIASLWNLTDDEVVDMLLLKAETEVVEKCLS